MSFFSKGRPVDFIICFFLISNISHCPHILYCSRLTERVYSSQHRQFMCDVFFTSNIFNQNMPKIKLLSKKKLKKPPRLGDDAPRHLKYPQL